MHSQSNFVSWNPSSKSQFISYSLNKKLQLLEFSDEEGANKRGIRELRCWDVDHVQCLDWRPCTDSPVVAYGTGTGNVHLLNVASAEESSVSQGTRMGRRPCNAVAWNRHMPSQLLSGFDSLRSEFCAAVWDFEHEHFMHASVGESASAVSWLPDNAHSFAVGTTMGWVKVYDTRANSQVSAACSVLAHPAPKPRRIRGIRPDPYRPHLFATYSDFPGDVVKVWDLRKVTNTSNKQQVVPASFSVIPITVSSWSTAPGGDASSFSSQFASSMAGDSESVVDVCWSTARPGVLAVATSVRRSVSFYSTSTVSGTSHVPIYSVEVPAPVQINGLSWQAIRSSLLVAGHVTAAAAPNSPLQADRLAVVASMTASPPQVPAGGIIGSPGQPQRACWEGFRGDEEMRACSYETILRPVPQHPTPAAGSGAGPQSHPRLLVAIVPVDDDDLSVDGSATAVTGFAEVEVVDRLPLSISGAAGRLAVTTVRGRNAALTNCSIGRVPCMQFASAPGAEAGRPGALSVVDCYRCTDVGELMRQRCIAGYSADANTNLEVLAEELDAVYAAMEGMSRSEVAFIAPMVANTKAVFRTWGWMHGFETTVSDASLTVSNCGILEVLVRSHIQYAASNIRQSSQWGSVKHPVLGATVYSSEGRDLAKKLCGWMKMFGISKPSTSDPVAGGLSRSSSGSVAAGQSRPPSGKRPDFEDLTAATGGEDDLLEVLVHELFDDSFERSAAFALWHGRIDIAVSVLQRAISGMEDGRRSPRQPPSPSSRQRGRSLGSQDACDDNQQGTQLSVVWDAAYDPEYLQTVSLVAMCFAGYHYPALTAMDPRPASPGKGGNVSPAAARTSLAGSTWASMCRHVIGQLERSQREASSYLIAVCKFLLANVGQSETVLSESQENASASKLFAPVLNDSRLNLEDRAAFACTFLPYEEAVKWLEDTVETCLAAGRIEAVLITGLSEAGMGVLQKYIDRYDDVQTVALLVSRVIDSHQSQGVAEGSAASGKKSGVPTKEWVWLHEYRHLLNKAEMFIERAYLDVELGKRYRRKAAMLSAQSGATTKDKSMQHASGASKRLSASKGTNFGAQPQGKSKASRVLYKLPVHSDFPHFYLRCGFCGASLPVDGMHNIRPDQLRTQNNVLHCCAACSKQLPRCYVCQLYMGMVNPYVELNRVMTQKRLSADKLILQAATAAAASGAPSIASGAGSRLSGGGGGGGGGGQHHDDDSSFQSSARSNPAWRPGHCADPSAAMGEHNAIPFGKWFFFCQHCRHGGHANCIDQWFGGTGNVSADPVLCGPAVPSADAGSGIVRRVVCGVNGCDCNCISRL